jgi:hypothetical protein
MSQDWQTASRESAKLVPLAQDDPEARIQIYSAKAFAWRGKFSVHTWIATKQKNADSYMVHHVMMWGDSRNSDLVVVSKKDLPDRYWYSAKPEIVCMINGKRAEKIIPKIDLAVKSYPYWQFYRAFPGPNSNTFVSYVMRRTHGFYANLPSNAIGKDWICNKYLIDLSESRTGFQFSLYGLLGFTIGLLDGIEINLLGFCFGIDFLYPAIKLPIIGRIGFK